MARSCNPRGNPKRPFLFFFFFPLRALVFTCSRGCQGEARLSLSHPSGQESGTQLWKQPQRLSRLRTCPCQRAVAEAAPLPHACWKKKGLMPSLSCSHRHARCQQKISRFSACRCFKDSGISGMKPGKKQAALFRLLASVLHSTPTCSSRPSYRESGSEIWQQTPSANPAKPQSLAKGGRFWKSPPQQGSAPLTP